MLDESIKLIQQLRSELREVLKDKEGVLVLDIPLDQPPPEHEPEYEELTIGLDIPYPPPSEPGGGFSYLDTQVNRLFGLLLKEIARRHILLGDTRPPWGEPVESTIRLLLECQRYPVLLSVTPIGPGYIRMMMTISVDPEVL
jgi:hypothetical protein